MLKNRVDVKHKKRSALTTAGALMAEAPCRTPAVHFNFREFDPKSIRDFSTIVVAGARRSGKSYCARDLLYHLRDRVYDMYVYSGTKDPDNRWEEFTPEKYTQYVETIFPDEHLLQVLRNQATRQTIADRHKVSCPPTMLMFEDLEFLKKSMWKNQSIRSVMFNGRWKRCFAIAAIQYIMEIDLAVRGMFDYAIFTACSNAAVRQRIYKQYAGVFQTSAEFEAAFAHCTHDHGVMVVDCRCTSSNPEDAIFHYKAKDWGHFHVGVEEVWDEQVDARNLASIESERQRAAAQPAAVPPALTKPKTKKQLEEGGIAITLLPSSSKRSK
jgi:hypothetical protein